MRALTLAVAALALPCAGASATPADVWAKLHRPLHLPALAPGAPCSVSEVDQRFKFAKYGVAPGLGHGPAYPIGFAQPGSVLRYTYPPEPNQGWYGSRWSGQKVLWFVGPAYHGPVLIRGKQLDGPELLRFEVGDVPPTEMRIPVATSGGNLPGGWRDRPSYTRLRAPGCYAYQVDGTFFSYAVVFRTEVQ
jgi:hypothetical protein